MFIAISLTADALEPLALAGGEQVMSIGSSLDPRRSPVGLAGAPIHPALCAA
jgi:hypothetical protein